MALAPSAVAHAAAANAAKSTVIRMTASKRFRAHPKESRGAPQTRRETCLSRRRHA